MKTIKKHLYINIFFLYTALLMCGCGVTQKSAPPSRSAVENAVAEELAGENFTIERVEHLDQIPQKDVYYIKSKDRDLEFQAVSYIAESDIGIGGAPIYTYHKEIDVKYWDAVKEYYRPAMEEIFSDATKSGIRYMYEFHNYEELMPVMEKIKKAEECFAEEQKYHNDPVWFQNHSVTSVDIRWTNDEVREDSSKVWVHVPTSAYNIFATADPQKTVKKISSIYADKILSGAIPADDKLPTEYLTNAHKEKLTKVIIGDTEMTDELSFMLGLTPSVVIEGVFYAEYNHDYDCYMMRVDPGCGSKRGRCHPLQAIIKAAGGTGGDKCDNLGSEEWKIGNNHYVISAIKELGVNRIDGITVTKNGIPMEVTYTNRTDLTRSSDMVFISVEDIARMIEMKVTVDEENGMVVFEAIP